MVPCPVAFLALGSFLPSARLENYIPRLPIPVSLLGVIPRWRAWGSAVGLGAAGTEEGGSAASLPTSCRGELARKLPGEKQRFVLILYTAENILSL